MSSLIVEIVKIDDVKTHPNADLLDIVIVKGWQIVTKRDEYKKGELAVYFPLDSILPLKLSDAIGVSKYLSIGRVKPIKLRNESSFGLLWKEESVANYLYPPPFDRRYFGEGEDMTEWLGVTKWEPPPDFSVDDGEKSHSNFLKYTDLENLRHYNNIIEEGEIVRITEKLHGGNSRFGLIGGEYMVGSHNMRKKENEKSKWWFPFYKYPKIKEMLKEISESNDNADVIIFGELLGIQDLKYGLKNGNIDWRCFDICINGKYMNYIDFSIITSKYKVPVVPILYRGPFSLEVVKGFEGKTRIEDATNIIEGVVVTPEIERNHYKIGRVILKYVYDTYLNRKGGTEFH